MLSDGDFLPWHDRRRLTVTDMSTNNTWTLYTANSMFANSLLNWTGPFVTRAVAKGWGRQGTAPGRPSSVSARLFAIHNAWLDQFNESLAFRVGLYTFTSVCMCRRRWRATSHPRYRQYELHSRSEQLRLGFDSYMNGYGCTATAWWWALCITSLWRPS